MISLDNSDKSDVKYFISVFGQHTTLRVHNHIPKVHASHILKFRDTDNASQYILSLMAFMVNNLAYFSLNSRIHNICTRNRKSLLVLEVNLSLYQKGVYYMTTKAFNSLSNWIAYLVQNRKIVTDKLKSVLMQESFYWVDNFLDYCGIL